MPERTFRIATWLTRDEATAFFSYCVQNETHGSLDGGHRPPQTVLSEFAGQLRPQLEEGASERKAAATALPEHQRRRRNRAR